MGDTAFTDGQLKDAQNLGDAGVPGVDGEFMPNWINAFKNQLHGVILISGDCYETVTATQATVLGIFNVGVRVTLHEVITLKGAVRPGDQSGHEQ